LIQVAYVQITVRYLVMQKCCW